MLDIDSGTGHELDVEVDRGGITWSPDGTELLFTSNRDPRLAIPCSFGVEITLGEPEPLETVVWTSTQVVVGEISERHEPVFADPHWFASGPCLEIVTEYTVEVETHFRGTDSGSLTVRVPGGAIDPYQAEIGNTPTYEPGERALLFLFDAPESELLPPAYGVDSRRSWHVSDEASDRIRKALEDGPPEELGTRLISLDEAPITE